MQQLKQRKVIDEDAPIKRRPLSWLDKPIRDNIEELANITGEFWGDEALRKVLEQMDKSQIKKTIWLHKRKK